MAGYIRKPPPRPLKEGAQDGCPDRGRDREDKDPRAPRGCRAMETPVSCVAPRRGPTAPAGPFARRRVRPLVPVAVRGAGSAVLLPALEGRGDQSLGGPLRRPGYTFAAWPLQQT